MNIPPKDGTIVRIKRFLGGRRVRGGSKLCKCGRRISLNKETCFGCSQKAPSKEAA